MRGRSLNREVFPFSFREFLDASGKVSIPRPPGSKTRLLLQQKGEAYLRTGGFPEVVGVEPQRHREILLSYIDAVILRDVVERPLCSPSTVDSSAP